MNKTYSIGISLICSAVSTHCGMAVNSPSRSAATTSTSTSTSTAYTRPSEVTSGLVADWDATFANAGTGPYSAGCTSSSQNWYDLNTNSLYGTYTVTSNSQCV